MAAMAKAEDYYSGAVNSNGAPHGIGEERYASGDVYVGKFVNGKRDGKGVMKFASGAVYNGEWEDDRRHGKGNLTKSNGNIDVGEFRNGKLNGRVVITHTDGSVYDGEWEDNESHGKGNLTMSNGDIYVGEFRNGKLNGRRVYTHTDGDVYDGGSDYICRWICNDGEWKDCRKHGKGNLTMSNGDIYVGEWENGETNGEFILTMANGESFKQVYVEGKRTSNKRCVFDVTPIQDLFSSSRPCANGTFDIIMLNDYDKECQVCMHKYLPGVDAKKPVVGSCNHIFCQECVIKTARSIRTNGGAVPTRIAWMHFVQWRLSMSFV